MLPCNNVDQGTYIHNLWGEVKVDKIQGGGSHLHLAQLGIVPADLKANYRGTEGTEFPGLCPRGSDAG